MEEMWCNLNYCGCLAVSRALREKASTALPPYAIYETYVPIGRKVQVQQ